MQSKSRGSNICVIRVPRKRTERKNEAEKNVDELIAKNFLKLVKSINVQIQETQ